MEKRKCRIQKSTNTEKLMKKIAKMEQKNIQPGECMKFIQVNIDNGIVNNFDFYQETVNILENSNVIYNINSSSLVPNNSITWTKKIKEYSIDYDNNKLNTTIKTIDENHMLIIWNWNDAVKQIYNKTLTAKVLSIATSMPQIKLTLVIYGIERYFKYYKRKSKCNNDHLFNNIDIIDIPKITRRDLELSLINIQIDINQLNTRLIDNSADMSLLIYQYTKAIAEKTYKFEINNKLCDQMDFFVSGDNKKTVKVDNDGYGLKKLWLKQLCMFNASTLASADALCSVYSSPDELINAYKNSSMENRDALLKDIEIKRAAVGPLNKKARKLGPELSRKIHTMFMSTNGEQLLN